MEREVIVPEQKALSRTWLISLPSSKLMMSLYTGTTDHFRKLIATYAPSRTLR
jgi:hypothetical protein